MTGEAADQSARGVNGLARRKEIWMLKRLGLYVIGVLLLGFSIVLNTRAGLGVGSINTFPYAMSQMTPLSLGTCSTLLYFVFVAAQLLIYRKIDGKILLQIPFSYVMGRVIDFFNRLLDFHPDSLPVQLAALAAAIVLTALGAYLMVTLDLIPNPADGMARAVGYALHKDFGQGKLIFDCVMVSITAAVSLIFAHRLIGIGVGTVLSALCIGRMIRVYGRILGPYMKKILEESRNERKRGAFTPS
ncbi:MAG: DUF6198 family protein [Eubacteriales bacterium]|nr:DUF6198 family protein [Eubacteriales bacterium]